mmetsp:Transcript_32997/g.78301  ORF Transcript_32997/g.78301 Transcript_32997/m.78301 type:complete len:128 (-) Transcript_32997:13-396(-)
MNKKGVALGLLTVVVLVIFAVNKIYENQHHLSTPLLLEVDEAQIVYVEKTAGGSVAGAALAADPIQHKKFLWPGSSLLERLQVQFNPWLPEKEKRLVAKKAVVFAKTVRSSEASTAAAYHRRLLLRE